MKRVFATFNLTLLAVFVLTASRSLDPTPLKIASEPEPPVAANGDICTPVNNLFISCVEYLIGADGNPSFECCKSVSAVKSSTPTTTERRAACKCFSDVAVQLPPLLDNKAVSLSKSCGFDLGFVMSKTADCNNVPVNSRQGRD